MKIYALGIALLGLVGCSHYHIGEPQTSHKIQRLRLGSVRNPSFAPQLEAQLRKDLELLFSRNPSCVCIQEPAQAVVDIVVTDYIRMASVKQERDGLVPRAFTLEATAQFKLKSLESNEIVFFKKPKTVQAHVELVRDTQALQAEYQSMPQLSMELAIKIHKALTQTW